MINRIITRILLLSLVCLYFILPLAAAAGKKGEQEEESKIIQSSGIDYFPKKTTIHYAEGFSVAYHHNYKVVTVHEPWPHASASLRYLLVKNGTSRPEGYDDSIVVNIPVERVVTLSTTYLAYMDMLGVTDRIIGHDDFKYVCTPSVRRMIDEGGNQGSGRGIQSKR